MSKEISNSDIIKRLNRVEGQIKGIKNMIGNEKYCCSDILTQVAAARSAINKVGLIILDKHSKDCISNIVESNDKQKIIDEMMNTLQRFVRFVD